LTQVCNGLSYAHGKGIIHQDIKPANIFVQDNGAVKIVDFGLACPAGSEDSMGLSGTPYYMAPEQIEGEKVDARADMYCLGITAFEMAAGQLPFSYKNVAEVLRAHCEGQMPDPRLLNADLPQEFCDFISRATRKNPEDRFQSMSEALECLRPLEEKIGLQRVPKKTEARKAMNLFMFYQDEKQKEVNRLIEKFGKDIRELGLEMRVAYFDDF